MKLKVKPCKYCNEHAIEMSRCSDINPVEPVRMLCTKCNFQIYGATENEAIERWNKEYDLAHKPKGVMIVGRKMPRTCIDCPCSQVTFYVDVYKDINETHFFCKNTSKRAYKTKRPSWCPLREVK